MRQRRQCGAAHYRALAVAAVLGLLAWWAWPGDRRGTAGVAPAATQASAATVVAAAPSALAVRTGAAPAPAPGSAALASALPPVELCGVGLVPRMPDVDPARSGPMAEVPDHLGRHALEGARQRVLAQLEAGGPRQRVIARLLQDLDLARQSGQPAPAGAKTEVLVKDAAASADPVALSAALRLCHELPEPVACQRQLVGAALQLEPGNARWLAEWLVLAPDADATWRALLQAESWRSGYGELAATVRAALPPDLPPYLALHLEVEGIALDSAVLVNVGPMLRRCRPREGDAPAASRADCDRLAHLMVERSDTVMTVMLGLRVAESAGWPDARRAEVRQALDALRAPFVNQPQPLGCAATEAFDHYLDRLSRDGELAAMRASLSSAPAHGPR